MALKKTPQAAPPQGPDGSAWEPVHHALEIVEQALAGGWYPARRQLLSRLASVPGPDLAVWVPEADVEETPREFVVTFALPGVEKHDIRVEVTEDTLTVCGRRREEQPAPGSVRRERPQGEFLRRMALPAEVKTAGVKAAYRNGVLRVILPRAKASFGRSVKVD